MPMILIRYQIQYIVFTILWSYRQCPFSEDLPFFPRSDIDVTDIDDNRSRWLVFILLVTKPTKDTSKEGLK
jgi:hypothetical protein